MKHLKSIEHFFFLVCNEGLLDPTYHEELHEIRIIPPYKILSVGATYSKYKNKTKKRRCVSKILKDYNYRSFLKNTFEDK